MMNKKIILIILITFTAIISNAQVKTKANHNTTRSNHSSGIMVRDLVKDKFDASKIRKLENWEITTKHFILISSNNQKYTYDGNSTVIENYFKKKPQNQTKIGCPTGYTPDGNGGCFKFQELECSSSTISTDDDGNLCIMNIAYTPNLNTNNLILIHQKGKTYALKKTSKILKLISKEKKKQAKRNCRLKGICVGAPKLKTWIEVESFNYGNNAVKRKKRNKNFNRKGERIKRTKF